MYMIFVQAIQHMKSYYVELVVIIMTKSRGKKKKKKKTLLKYYTLAAALVAKLCIFLKVVHASVLYKMFLVALAALLLHAARFWLDVKKGYNPRRSSTTSTPSTTTTTTTAATGVGETRTIPMPRALRIPTKNPSSQ
ncbi:hypothetical protein NQ317_009080 [Molorchus minor]|uniref:Uncharacterized protein n=1 Tax=Molorchus minor TaxID=1323400 RepID=A0ABQ9JF02_9CUCU|nr:hypothetical protein NQ317_009080 [Molorchus minor]